ncbi:MAG: hypothetical protein V1847_05275 [Candidatus Diapherotrites archaeon]
MEEFRRDKGLNQTKLFERVKSALLHVVPSMEGEKLDAFTIKVMNSIDDREVEKFSERITPFARNYLKERKIPFDRRAFLQSLSDVTFGKRVRDFRSGLDWNAFEKSYRARLKFEKVREFGRNNILNEFVRRAFPLERLSNRQFKRVKQVIEQRMQAFLKVGDELILEGILRGLSDFELDQLLLANENAFLSTIKEDVLKEFSFSNKKGTVNQRATAEIAKGDRARRMAEYSRTPSASALGRQNVQARERAEQRVAQARGKPFDEAEFDLKIFGENSQYNSEAPKLVEKLVRERALNRQNLHKLAIAGPLCQRVFVETLSGTSFLQEFGNRQVNALAFGLANIGSEGKKIEKAKTLFIAHENSKMSESIYHFLVKNGVLEVDHGGGKVVYIHRPQTRR